MRAGLGAQVQLREDPLGVLLDRPFGDDQLGGDPGVGVALRHEGEHVAFARGEGGDRVAAAAQELLHDVGVEDAAARRDGLQGGEELVDLGDAILEQVAQRAGSGRRQVVEVGDLDVLAQQQDIGYGKMVV